MAGFFVKVISTMQTYLTASPNLGVIYKKNNQTFDVLSSPEKITCTLAPKLKRITPEVLTVGDHVCFEKTAPNNGIITQLLPRRNQLMRRSAVPMPGAYAHGQVIAANVDQIVPVFAVANPLPKWGMLDRYLVAAEANEIPALIVISKMDLVTSADAALEDALQAAVADYRRIGYTVILTSAKDKSTLAHLKQALIGKTSVFAGKSGVGKSSLLNAMQPGLGLRTNAVNQITGKGKHTTTHLEMFPLDFGGAIIDTPGVREFGLWDVDAENLDFYFPEMQPLIGNCRFGMGCHHNEEPGCAIRKAVMQGQISPRRYQSYMKLRAEQ